MYEWQNPYKKPVKFSTLRKYVELYSETDLFTKLSKVGLKIGAEVLFYVILLYYLLSDKSVPIKNKLVIMGALGYFILPTDLIADFIPVLGFTDDAAFLSFALSSVLGFVTPEVIKKAKTKIGNLLNDDFDSTTAVVLEKDQKGK